MEGLRLRGYMGAERFQSLSNKNNPASTQHRSSLLTASHFYLNVWFSFSSLWHPACTDITPTNYWSFNSSQNLLVISLIWWSGMLNTDTPPPHPWSMHSEQIHYTRSRACRTSAAITSAPVSTLTLDIVYGLIIAADRQGRSLTWN